ncbi:MAG: metallophosphoesterase [Lachnospiraceae bacterium]|nr:metallophosphoesterase [Lachnospiraceae bacterium]
MRSRKNRTHEKGLPESQDGIAAVIGEVEKAEPPVPEPEAEKAEPPVPEIAPDAAAADAAKEIGEIKKRKWAGNLIRGLAVVILCLAVFFCAGDMASRHYQITFYQEICRFLTGNIRIVFISDLHSREYGQGNADLLADIAALSPDLILLGGDMINWNDTDYEPVLETCRALTKLAPVYGVPGNHESERIYNAGDQDLYARFENAGVTMLRNESKIVRIGDNSVQLIGITGTEDGFERNGAQECMTQIPANRNMYRVVLAHVPVLFKEKLASYSYDLGLAGHAHGGVIQIPRIGGLYSAEEGFLPAYSRGEYELRNGASLIVGGGLGDAGWLPRINNRPELLVIDVNWC